MKKTVQTIIPKKVVEMAKAIQEADQKKQQLVIIQKRNYGRTAALDLARGNLN